MESDVPTEELFGQIVFSDDYTRLGGVYFRYNQWVCTYGMKYILNHNNYIEMRLAFETLNTSATFCITDYQIVMFDDLASANSFVNSREFAVVPTE